MDRPERLIREPEVHQRTGLSRTTRWREIKAERFPAPLKLTSSAIAWRESEIEAWIASRTSSRHVEAA